MQTLLIQAYLYSFYVLLVLVTLAAMWWGGRTERIVALLFVAAVAGTKLLKNAVAFDSMEAGVLIVDSILVVLLIVIAIKTGKGWLIWATAFQLIATLGHLGKLLNPELSRMGYSLAESFSSHPTQIALAIGIYLHRRRMIAAAAGTSSATY